MKSESWLWSELHFFFDTDDGSLPEIRINYNDTKATVAGYVLLRERAAQNVTVSPYFWSKIDNAEHLVDSVPNAAALVVAGEADPFHVVFGGIQSGGTTIPDIGVFVFPNQIALDYRMGLAWGPKEVEALFELIAVLSALDPQATLSLEYFVLPEIEARFQQAWQRWSAEQTS